MPVTVDEIINFFGSQFFFGVDDEKLLVFSHKLLVFFPGNHFVFGRKINRHLHRDIRMKPFESPLRKRIREQFLHSLVAFISRTQTVTMSKQEIFSVNLEVLFIKKNFAANFFFKVIFHPKIVVTDEHIKLNP